MCVIKACQITSDSHQVCVKIDLEDGVYDLSLTLSNPVNVSKCFIKVYGTKVCILFTVCYLVSASSVLV